MYFVKVFMMLGEYLARWYLWCNVAWVVYIPYGFFVYTFDSMYSLHDHVDVIFAMNLMLCTMDTK